MELGWDCGQYVRVSNGMLGPAEGSRWMGGGGIIYENSIARGSSCDRLLAQSGDAESILIAAKPPIIRRTRLFALRGPSSMLAGPSKRIRVLRYRHDRRFPGSTASHPRPDVSAPQSKSHGCCQWPETRSERKGVFVHHVV